MPYNHQEIEKKWQARWEKDSAFQADASKKSKKGNLYILDMFPYPSGAGLHVGHPEGYTATDITARKRRMEGFNVLHPMGWDAFGLPAENYAIKQGGHPRDITRKNIDNFRRQIKSFGFSYDWDREISTCEPEYYKWTQWLFLLLWKNDLAYRAKAPVNWCPTDNTVLANEQVVDGKCDRCGTPVVQKELEQWFFRITKYADRLLAGLDKLDWPERIKAMQRNWIGKSVGVEIDFDVIDVNPPPARGGVGGGGRETVIRVFTTRPDTLMGVSYIVLAPEHPLLDELVTEDHQDDLVNYRDQARKKSELERTQLEKDKAGIFTGAYAHHPLTGELVPIWVSDYVLTTYGTGAVMGVPAHDERDYAFAKKYDLPIKWVIAPPAGSPRSLPLSEGEPPPPSGGAPPRAGEGVGGAAYTDMGILVNSGMFDGLTSTDAKQKIADALEGEEKGRRVTFYRIRDWLVSRQRYWGAPIPAIWCEDCGAQPVDPKNLPVILPDDVDFKPTGQSPLVGSKSFHDVKCPKCKNAARRESDTMDTFVDSSWYFLRYTDPTNTKVFADEAAIKAWCPVDLYVGGAEHAVLHLLYSRFVCYALKDLGYLEFDEPFIALRNQGLILGPDGEKMSKSKGNVVNPDEIVSEYGADTLRLYEMFMGPLEDAKPWDTKGVVGVRRFLDKVWMARERLADSVDPAIDKAVAKCVKRVGDDTDAMKFNTAIAEMMKCANVFAAAEAIPREAYMTFVRTMAPYAPHLAEELWSEVALPSFAKEGLATAIGRGPAAAVGEVASGARLGVFYHGWPVADESLLKDSIVAVAVQVNGKLRATIDIAPDLSADEARARAEATENVAKHLEGKEVKKVVYVAGRVINFIAV